MWPRSCTLLEVASGGSSARPWAAAGTAFHAAATAASSSIDVNPLIPRSRIVNACVPVWAVLESWATRRLWRSKERRARSVDFLRRQTADVKGGDRVLFSGAHVDSPVVQLEAAEDSAPAGAQ